MPGLFTKLKLAICARRGIPRRFFYSHRARRLARLVASSLSTVAPPAWLFAPSDGVLLFPGLYFQ
jgi:hypothetical protein